MASMQVSQVQSKAQQSDQHCSHGFVFFVFMMSCTACIKYTIRLLVSYSLGNFVCPGISVSDCFRSNLNKKSRSLRHISRFSKETCERKHAYLLNDVSLSAFMLLGCKWWVGGSGYHCFFTDTFSTIKDLPRFVVQPVVWKVTYVYVLVCI